MARRIGGSTEKHAAPLWTAAAMRRPGAAPWLLPVLAAAMLVPILEPRPAHAGCGDVPAPGVDWRRCVLDAQVYTGVDLTGAVLRDASLKRADLSGSALENVDARGIKLVSAVLRGANLEGANLVRADLTKADLSGASLRSADLTQAKLFRTDFHGADLTGARLANADMLRANFVGATWIDGKTVCAEGSIGHCNAVPARDDAARVAVEPSG